jgi:hypothetical protein
MPRKPQKDSEDTLYRYVPTYFIHRIGVQYLSSLPCLQRIPEPYQALNDLSAICSPLVRHPELQVQQ